MSEISKIELTRRETATQPCILVIDDAPENLNQIAGLLEGIFRVRLANNGLHGLEIACGESPPDLILLDVLMPQPDGYEVLRKLKQNEATRHIPVIFLTALQNEEDEQRGLELGAADYLHKPMNGVILLSRIRVQLDAKATRDLLRRHNERLQQRVEDDARTLEQAQLQLMQSEKMASMGQLAAGIAHEINNPTAFVSSNLGALQTYFEQLGVLLDAYESARVSGDFSAVTALREKMDVDFMRRDIVDLLNESRDGMERVRNIVLDLKNFSHVGATRWEWADLHQGLDSTLNIVWNELKYKCTITKHYGELPQIYCLPSQLNQVFMNLLVNAAQAIETRGEIEIVTVPLGTEAVQVSIRDTGKGIAAADIKRIFDPFYTTKPVGQGTGLGLSLSRDIIERHHGRIEVSSTPGKGTTFTITLPVDPSLEGGATGGGQNE